MNVEVVWENRFIRAGESEGEMREKTQKTQTRRPKKQRDNIAVIYN